MIPELVMEVVYTTLSAVLKDIVAGVTPFDNALKVILYPALNVIFGTVGKVIMGAGVVSHKF